MVKVVVGRSKTVIALEDRADFSSSLRGLIIALMNHMRLIAALLVIAITSGCVTTVGRRVGAVSVGALSVGLIAGGVAASHASDPSSHTSEAPGLAVDIFAAAITVALVTGIVALGVEMSSAPVAIVPTQIGVAPPCDPRAEQLTRDAPRLGQCGAVKSFGESR
jgi:hypothetical protein